MECAFGMLVKRWGILWRSLDVKFNNIKRVVGEPSDGVHGSEADEKRER